MIKAGVFFAAAALLLLLLLQGAEAHLTDVCLSRLSTGDLFFTVLHWHDDSDPLPVDARWELSSPTTGNFIAGTFDGTTGGCNALSCPATCTTADSCGASQASQGGFFALVDDTAPTLFTPGETIVYTFLGADIILAPTGSCTAVPYGVYGINGGSTGNIVVPPASSTCVADICGDNVVTAGESCEAGMLLGMTCELLGFDGGTLGCSECCTYDTSACFSCNDAASPPVLSGCQASPIISDTDPGVCCVADTFSVSASDPDQTATNCPAPSLSQTMGAPSGSCYADGDTIQWTTVDSAGNAVTCSWFYIVNDREPPVFTTCPAAPVSIYQGDTVNYATWVTVGDNCGDASVTIQVLNGPAEGSMPLDGTYAVELQATDFGGNVNPTPCVFTLMVDGPIINVTQPDSYRPIPADLATESVFFYMYLPVFIWYAEDHQQAFGQAAGDGSFDYFQIVRNSDGQVLYTSEFAPTSTTPDAYLKIFNGPFGIYPELDLQLRVCMSPSNVCVTVYADLVFCANPFANGPQGCAFLY